MSSAVPDVLIDPLRTGLFGVLLWINSRFFQPSKEHRILQCDIPGAMVVIEGVVSREYIIMTPTERPGICRQHTSIVPRVPSSLHERDG